VCSSDLPPDLVLSGINHGHNAGRAVLHSGTVGAALTGRTFGRRSMAISLAMGRKPRWDTAAIVAADALALLVRAKGDLVLNVNVPDVAPGQLRPLARARLATFGAVTATITERGAGHVKLAYAAPTDRAAEDSDVALLAAGHPTFTPLRTVCEDDDVVVA